MVSALDKLRASFQDRYGEESAMVPSEMPKKGVVSSGSLSFDYMLGTFGIPRDIVMELGGKPGVSKTTLSLSILNNVLCFEYERALKMARAEKALKDHKLSNEDFDVFELAYRRQEGDLHVFTGKGAEDRNRLIDEYPLTAAEEDSVRVKKMRSVAFLDLEGRFDPDWASRYIDRRFLETNFLVIRNDTIESATDAYRELVTSKAIAAVVIDSIGGAPSKRVFEKSSEKGDVGGNSAGVSEFAKFAENLSSKYTCLTIAINQVRDDMSGYRAYVTPGGWAFKHACSLRVELKRSNREGWVFKDTLPGTTVEYECGFKVAANLRKTSIGLKGVACEFIFYTHDCVYGKAGFDRVNELVHLAVLSGQIKKRGGWYSSEYFGENKRLNGEKSVAKFLLSHEDVFDRLYEDMKARLNSDDGIDGVLTEFDETSGEKVNPVTGEIE